ncbi:FAD:protein FMN transferase [Janthinobacterium sp. CG_23.3]|uniref:FAD:protein FMN transferase n=1 Tax=unclassified Janthinobacterium TaxID=2610881 RepID=UPI00034B27B0|nr:MULTISPECIES: FAD:protein FMN transferase [unclassified Janthinobacterium]MEC5161467.1 thiamine biosynthesis lipoprotein [Janthinobacterium sp. CG_S6]
MLITSLRKTCVLLACASFAAGAAEPAIQRIPGHVFGTAVEVTIYGETEERAGQLGAAVLKEFDRLHHKFHAWQPSALTALNDAIARGDSYQGDAEMVDLLQSAGRLAARSDNLFNPAIGGLIRLWGFQSSDIGVSAPSAAAIRRWVDAKPRMSDLRYDGNRISSRNRAVMLDLGGYAKGYALDRAAALLRAQHVRAALVNIGGNVLAIGQPGRRPWRVGVRDPRGAGAVARLELRDNEAIGTSGDYQRYFMNDGKRHPHIIDPRSGDTVDLVASVTIIAAGGAHPGIDSDGPSKPLFIAGPKRWRSLARRLGLTHVLLIDATGAVAMTPAMRARMVGAPP